METKNINYTLEECQKLMDENGGFLDLRGAQITTLPDGLTVGGYLDLEGTQITTLPDNLTVGGYLDFRDTRITNPIYKRLQDGDYVEGRYLYADGILIHVSRRKEINGYAFYVGKIKGKNVVSDGTHYAHCKTLREGIADLQFKAAKDRGAAQYKGRDMDELIPFDEAVAMYRIITGACAAGTQSFIDTLCEVKEAYSIREIINVTCGSYGANTFKEFFEDADA